MATLVPCQMKMIQRHYNCAVHASTLSKSIYKCVFSIRKRNNKQAYKHLNSDII